MARKSIGGIDEAVKERFDEAQRRMAAPSASEALRALLDAWAQAEAERGVGEAHARGMERVAEDLDRTRRDMYLVLADVQSQADHDAEGAAERIARLEAELRERDARIEESTRAIASMEAELETAVAKAASVDALAARLAETEAAWGERFARLMSAIGTVESEGDARE